MAALSYLEDALFLMFVALYTVVEGLRPRSRHPSPSQRSGSGVLGGRSRRQTPAKYGRRQTRGKQKKRLYRCKGVTLKGKRCKRKQRGHIYCPHHRSQAQEAAALKPFGLRPRASESALKSAYRELVRQHHPDVGGNPATFRAVNEAYEKAKLVIT